MKVAHAEFVLSNTKVELCPKSKIPEYAFIGRSNISVPTGDASIFRAADNTLAFATASTERVRIDSSGRFGIGTASVGALLHVSSGTTNNLSNDTIFSDSNKTCFSSIFKPFAVS